MIDAHTARQEPDEFRRRLARKGAAEAFDAWLAADEQWRELVPRVDELRSRTKVKGKPTPEQLEALLGTGHFPADEDSVYAVPADGLYLSGTAEIPVSSLHAGEILDARELPLRYVAFSPCFRREAGAAGKDTRGMFRVHQFNKVEQFALTLPESSWDEHEFLLANTEELVRELGVPYRVVVLPAGDMSSAAAKTYDCEG